MESLESNYMTEIYRYRQISFVETSFLKSYQVADVAVLHQDCESHIII